MQKGYYEFKANQDYRVRYKQTNMLIKCCMSPIVSFRLNKHIWAGWKMAVSALPILSWQSKSLSQPLLEFIRDHI